LPQVRYEEDLCSGAQKSGKTLYEFTFQDVIQRLNYVWRIDDNTNWTLKRLKEYGQSANIAMPYFPDPSAHTSSNPDPEDHGSIMYRGVSQDEVGLYAQKIVANPPEEVQASARLTPIWYVSQS